MSGPIFHGFPFSKTPLPLPKKSNKHLLALTIIIILALIIRIHNLAYRSLWWDEIFSVTNAQQGPLHILMSQDPARSYPYHLTLWLFLQFGNNEFIARLPSALFSILSIPLFYLLAKQLYNRKTALLSTFMLMFWPYHVWYAQEARMYSLFFLVTTASMLVYLKMVNEKKGWLWLLYLPLTILGFYTHFYYIFVFGIQLLYMIYLAFTKKLSIKWESLLLDPLLIVFGTVTIGVVMFPWFSGAMQMLESGPGLNIPWGFTADTFWIEMFSYLSDGKFGALIGVPLFLFGLVQTWRRDARDVGVLTGLWVFAPLCLLFAITVLVRPMTHNRYTIFILPAYLPMLAYGLIQLCERFGSRRSFLGAFFLATMVFGTFAAMTVVTFPIQRREDWRGVTEYLNLNVAVNDYVLIYPSGCDKCLDYYGIQHPYEFVGGHKETVEWAMGRNSTVWIVYYGWGAQKTMFEGLLFPARFELVKYAYQISVYKR